MPNEVVLTVIGLTLLVTVPTWAVERNYRSLDVRDEAIQESLVPIRPGIHGQRPFWNAHSRRFIHVPAFDFKAVPGLGPIS